MGTRIYVGNLSFHTDADRLRDAFAQYGDVADVKVITDRETGRSRGFAFVTMANAEDLKTAISNMDGANVDGRALRVNEAEDKPRGNDRGFGGGGGGGGGRNGGGGGGGRW